jgi:RimJ/RimL family protein N-acetyltransferase
MEILTLRLRLREFRRDDAADLLAYQSDPRYLRYYPRRRRTEADVERFLDVMLFWQAQEPRYRFQLAVERLGEGHLIGNCGIRKPTPEADEAELGYELDPGLWGQGYATEAAGAMVQWAWSELGVHRIWAECVDENRASQRVLAKVGLVPVGKLPSQRWIKGRWHDVLLYSASLDAAPEGRDL